jgi:hypothetical protein
MGIFYPGTRVIAYDSNWTDAMREGVVVKWYGYMHTNFGMYRSLVDIKFDGEERISHGHFTRYVKLPQNSM